MPAHQYSTTGLSALCKGSILYIRSYVLSYSYVCIHIKTHGSVSVAKKQKIHETKKKYAWAHQCVTYATGQVADFSLS